MKEVTSTVNISPPAYFPVFLSSRLVVPFGRVY